MQIQTATEGAVNETVYRVARNSFTKTLGTASVLSSGQPAVLASASLSVNGYDLVYPDTKGQTINNLLIGVVHSYPGTVGWMPEDIGLVQCYGLRDVFMNIATKSDTLAAGTLLTPNTGTAFATSLPPIYATGTVASSAVFTGISGVAGLIVLAQTVATQASETFTAKGFVRCMGILLPLIGAVAGILS